MTGLLTLCEIKQALLDGVIDAQERYEKWSGGSWLWRAPEYLATTSVAAKLMSLSGGKLVTLENNVADSMQESGADWDETLSPKMRRGGRFDILLWWEKERPRAPIEIKVQVISISKLRSDISRIERVLLRNVRHSTMQFGAIAFYISQRGTLNKPADDKIIRTLGKIEAEAQTMVNQACCVSCSASTPSFTTYQDGSNGAWAAAVLILSARSKVMLRSGQEVKAKHVMCCSEGA